MREIQASEAQVHLPQLLDDVERGETLIITRHGRAIARIVPEMDRRQEEVDRALMRTLLFAPMLTLVLAIGAFGQTATSQPTGLITVLANPTNISLVSYSLAQIADSTTDWSFKGPLSGRQYNVSPAQRTTFAACTAFGALAVAHYYPKARPWVTGALVIGTAILSGRAYAHTLSHGTPAPAASVTVRR